MGTYSAQQHIDLFGGLPEPGEAAVDVLDLADRRRDEAGAFEWATVPAKARPIAPCGAAAR